MSKSNKSLIKETDLFKTYRDEESELNLLYTELSEWKYLDVPTSQDGDIRWYDKYEKCMEILKAKKDQGEKMSYWNTEFNSNPIITTTKIRFQLTKTLVVCPKCHKVHVIEDVVKIKPEFKEIYADLKANYPYVLSMIAYSYYAKNLSDEMFYHVEGKKIYTYRTFHWENSIMECPDCGCSLNKYPLRKLYIDSKFDNFILRSYTIFSQEGKVKLSALYRTYYLNHKAMKIAVDEFRVQFVLNTATGKSYIIGPMKGGKRISGWKQAPIINMTYRCPFYYSGPGVITKILGDKNAMRRLLFTLLDNKKYDLEMLTRGLEPPTIKETEQSLKTDTMSSTEKKEEELSFEQIKQIIEEEYPGDEKNYHRALIWYHITKDYSYSYDEMTIICLLNRLPQFGLKDIMYLQKTILLSAFSRKYISSIFGKVKQDTQYHEICGIITDSLNIPNTKANRKIITGNMLNIFMIKCLKKMGFTDINVIHNIFNNESLITQYKEFFFSGYLSVESLPIIFTFTKKLIKVKGQPTALKAINDINYLNDTAVMYKKLVTAESFQQSFFNGNLKEIHDRLSVEITNIKKKNVPITYSKSMQNLAFNFGEFTFELAKDTHELIKVGQEMHICVGGYDDYALSGQSIIVLMKKITENGTKYVGCIELNKDKKLIQAKAVCNNLLQEYKAEALKAWVAAKNIKASECCDYTHILNNKIIYNQEAIYQSTTDYHYYEVDENGQITTPDQRNNVENITEDIPVDNDAAIIDENGFFFFPETNDPLPFL